MDILDSGSLKIQYNRNRYYDYYTGRWLTHDPQGIMPNSQGVNEYNTIGQYKDGMSLYEYVMSRPTVELDSHGLWGYDTHYERTMLWAVEENEMLPWAAERVGYWTHYVDTWKNPFTTVHAILSWHFDMDSTEIDAVWGSTDSRYCHAEDELLEAISVCNSGDWKDRYAIAEEALEHLGKALHPVQDFVSHGSWKPWLTFWHLSPFHPAGTDTWRLDFKHHPDGILRDWDYYGGPPSLWPWGLFESGTKRSKLTKKLTLQYMKDFKDAINGTKCACPIYTVNQ